MVVAAGLSNTTRPGTYRDYTWAYDVVMLQADTNVTTVDLSSNTLQVARGSIETDINGSRQATVMFPSGITATMILADGSSSPLTTLNVRATEFTVGDTGPAAMPAELPPTSAYTYAVDLSVDEAVAANAKQVQFSQQIPVYVDNYRQFPTGLVVPSGYYDTDIGAWVASKNGKVIEILSLDANGLAELDVTGSGVVSDATALGDLGITDEERQKLAQLYLPGKTLWRVPVSHFTGYDFNQRVGIGDGATRPNASQATNGQDTVNDCTQKSAGSIIECQNQVLGEKEPITGIEADLYYSSERVHGRKSAFSLNVSLTDSAPPSNLKEIILEVYVAGQVNRYTFNNPQPDMAYTYIWDGLDGYGRPVNSSAKARVRIGYRYPAIYLGSNSAAENSFAQAGISGGFELSGGENPGSFTWTVWDEHTYTIGTFTAKGEQIGGWTLSQHHRYDPVSRTLYKGYGDKSQADQLDKIITTIAGTGVQGSAGDGGLAEDAQYDWPTVVTVSSDGIIYTVDHHAITVGTQQNYRVRKISPDGIVTTIYRSGSGIDIAAGPDGSLYVLDAASTATGSQIIKISPDGSQTQIMGNGSSYGDGIPASQGKINAGNSLSVANDGSIFVADPGRHRIRIISTDSLIRTVAGGGTVSTSQSNGILATEVNYPYPGRVQADNEGGFYFVDPHDARLFHVDRLGINTIIAGTGTSASPIASYLEGRVATQANMNFGGITVGPNNHLYLCSSSGQVFRIDQTGRLRSVVGVGETPENNYTLGFGGDEGPARDALMQTIQDIAFDPDGNMLLADTYNNRLRSVSLLTNGYSDTDIRIASEDGAKIYVFDNTGRHLSTLNALTQAVLYEFIYDSNGLLMEMHDADGDVTTIERDGSVQASAIVTQDGQRTSLLMDGNGYLSAITNPAGEEVDYTYTSEGLLTSRTDARGNSSTMSYDALGRLTDDTNAELGGWALARTGLSTGYQVDKASAMGRLSQYKVETLANGARRNTNIAPDGSITIQAFGKDNGRKVFTAADGTKTTVDEGPDPRFGMQAAIPKSQTIALPLGLTSTTTMTRGVTYDFSGNLATQTDSIVINGRQTQSTFDAGTMTGTITTPTGRTMTTTINSIGRPTERQSGDLAPVRYSYDTRGRLTDVTQGSGSTARTTSISYNNAGYLADISDALGRVTSYSYDAAGRVIEQTLPDGRYISYIYDNNGNLTSLTPPGRTAHIFDYDTINQETGYQPPAIGSGTFNTVYDYNLDKQLELITRPDGRQIDYVYDDTTGKLTDVILPRQTLSYTYDSAGRLTILDTVEGSSTTSSLNYSYDGSLLLSETLTGQVSGSTTFNYDNNFWLTGITVDDGATSATVSYGYDNDGMLTQAGDLSISRDVVNGLPIGTTLGTVAADSSYNSFGELENYSSAAGGATLLSDSYTRDALGRITAKTETIGGVTTTTSYDYDTAGRLTSVTENGVTIHGYQYDSNGNRTHVDGNLIASYDDQDRLMSYGTASYAYTANGELLSKTDSGEITQYDYDVLGNLKKVVIPSTVEGSLTIDYLIDGRNRRIGKQVNGTLVQGFLYQDQLNPVAELDGNGNIVSTFVYGSKANVPDYMIKGGMIYWVVSDHLGSPRLVINTIDGSIAQQMDYDVWGNVVNDTNPGFQPFGFAGGLYDQHTGQVRFGSRDYDPQTGRWTAKDPIRFDGEDVNLYGYTFNDPINWVDLNGLESYGVRGSVVGGENWGIFNFAASTTSDLSAGTLASDVEASAGKFSVKENNGNLSGSATAYKWHGKVQGGFSNYTLKSTAYVAAIEGSISGTIKIGSKYITFTLVGTAGSLGAQASLGLNEISLGWHSLFGAAAKIKWGSCD